MSTVLADPQEPCHRRGTVGTQNKETWYEQLLATTTFSLLTFRKGFHNEHILFRKKYFNVASLTPP